MLNVKWKIVDVNFDRDQILVEYKVLDVPLLAEKFWTFWITIPTQPQNNNAYDINALKVFIDNNIPAQEIALLMHTDPAKTNEHDITNMLGQEEVVDIDGRIVTVVGITSMPLVNIPMPIQNNTITV
jgi:hypothetical protein